MDYLVENPQIATLNKANLEKGGDGTSKDGEIMVQGNFKDKIFDILVKEGYTQTKKKGGN
jgi:translation initiation factor 1 (eIF-1/SUI1)